MLGTYTETGPRPHATERRCALHILINVPCSRLAAKSFDVQIAHNSCVQYYTRAHG